MKPWTVSLIALFLLCSAAVPSWSAARVIVPEEEGVEQVLDIDDDAGAEGDERGAPLNAEEAARLTAFAEPEPGYTPPASVLELDPTRKIPGKLLRTALAYYYKNLERIGNKDVLTIVDFSQSSRKARLFFVDMRTGRVNALHVAHGSGSDPRGTGVATIFKNVVGSNCSSLGFYLTGETYSGKYGHSLRLDGLSETNSKVRERTVVIHGSNYVREADVLQGRSWGCLAVSMTLRTEVVDRVKGNSLIYAGLSAE